MKKLCLGDKFKTKESLRYRELNIPKGTDFEIDEVLEDGEYKILFLLDTDNLSDYEVYNTIQIMSIEEINEIKL